jgi:hypothetical protein
VIVVENKQKKYLEVKEVMECVRIPWMSEAGGGALKKGDVLVMIGRDNIEKWPLRRVVQRVNEFRAPTGRAIRMRFRRKVLKPGFEAEPEDMPEPEPTSEPTSPVSPMSQQGSFWGRSDTYANDDAAFAEGGAWRQAAFRAPDGMWCADMPRLAAPTDPIFMGEGVSRRPRMLFLESFMEEDGKGGGMDDSSYPFDVSRTGRSSQWPRN